MSKPRAATKSISAAEYVWLKTEFDKLHNEHLLILKKIDDIQTVVSPALEEQVRKAFKIATVIDRKVPDYSPSPVPPNKPPQRKANK